MAQRPDPSPAVSVIVPSSRPAALGGQLRALARQELDVPWELIVVTADPAALLPLAAIPGAGAVRVVADGTRRGPAAARNAGARAARGPLLAFCDDDDEVGDGWLRALVGALATADAAAGPWDLRRLNDGRTIAAYGLPQVQESLALVWEGVPFGETSNLGVRREVYDALGGFHEPMRTAEDRDLSARLQHAGHTLAFVPEAVVHRRLRTTTASIAAQAFWWGYGDALLYRRHRAHGMPRGDGARGWARLVRDAPQLWRPLDRSGWARRLAERSGRLAGSVRYGVRYL